MSRITFGNNISSLYAQRQLGRSTRELETIYERLSSGQRINKASDDAAGLAVASGLNSQAVILGQAVRNVNDGVSRLNIADGALAELANILQRQIELAEQAANGTYGFTQRKAMNTEANALVDEFNRIIQSTQFNGSNLLGTPSTTLDLQAGSGSNSTISLSTNSELARTVGAGTFRSATSYVTGTSVLSMLSADVNSDGKVDLVSSGPNFVDVLLGNGDGTFLARRSYVSTVATNLDDIDIGDFNGDGVSDILGSGSTGNVLMLYLGNSNGTFKVSTSIANVGGPYSSSVGDFNRDGYLDFAAGSNALGKINIHLGNGNGTFKASTSYLAPSAAGMNTADLNLDGNLDLVIGDSVNPGRFSVLMGNADGTFKATISYSVDSHFVTRVVLRDVNGDGYTDMVSGSTTTNTRVAVNIGNGDGSFRIATTYQTGGTYSHEVAVGDINGDGVFDIVAANYASNSTSVLLGNANGTFKYGVTFSDTGVGPHGIVLADLNADGADDIATPLYGGASIDVFLANTTRVTTIAYHHMFSQDEARQSLATMQAALTRVNAERGTIGSGMSRLGVTLNVLQNSREQHIAAAARITDADIATETANLVRLQILQNAAAAIAAQANQQPQLALKLLSS